MKGILKITFVIILWTLLTAGFVAAQTNDPGIQKRMDNQEKRIDWGVQSGQLTPREAGRLEADQARIQQKEQRMKSDGKLNRKERARLHQNQDRASRHIYKQKHDRQRVPVN